MKILIVDDEQLARGELRYLVEHSPVVQDAVVSEADSLASALKLLVQENFDLLFLDIALNHESGLDLAADLAKLKHRPLLVFATAYDQYAVQAFSVQAVDYLLKPFEQDRVDKTLDRVKRIMAKLQLGAKNPAKPTPPKDAGAPVKGPKLVKVELADRTVILKPAEIESVKVADGKLTFTLPTKQAYTTTKTLAWAKEKLANTTFIQVSRYALVNLEYIKELQPWFNHTALLILTSGEKVPVGRAYLPALNARLNA